jgi:Mg2+ and Co2+ transporter CorA
MLERLARAIRAELTTIESLERRADEDRQLRWSVAIGFVSAVAVPVTLVLTFFGVNAQEVDVRVSMFDGRYWGIYWLTAAIVVTGVVASLGLYLRQRNAMRRDRR